MIDRLHAAISSACPGVVGVSVGTAGDPATVRVDFPADATDARKSAALAALAAFDWSDAADAAWREGQAPERKTLRQAAAAAVADLDAFLALAAPTQAQTLAVVKKLAQQNRAIIRRLVQID